MSRSHKKNPAAVALGRKGGLKKSDKKSAANKANINKRWDNHKKHVKTNEEEGI